MSLKIIFSDSTRPSGEELVVLRELRGRATLPSRYVGGAHTRVPSFNSSFSFEVISLSSDILHLSDGDDDGGDYDDGDYDDGDYDDDDDDDDDDDCDDDDDDDDDYDDDIYGDCLYIDDGDYGDYGDGDEVYCFSAHEISGACTTKSVPSPTTMPVLEMCHFADGGPASSTLQPADIDSVRNPDEDSPRGSIVSGRSRRSIISRANLLREQARAEEKHRDYMRAERNKACSEERYADAIMFKVWQDEASERAKSLHRQAAEQYFKGALSLPLT